MNPLRGFFIRYRLCFSYGVSDQFRDMGIEVIPMGESLSDCLMSDGDRKVRTF